MRGGRIYTLHQQPRQSYPSTARTSVGNKYAISTQLQNKSPAYRVLQWVGIRGNEQLCDDIKEKRFLQPTVS